MMNQTQKHTTGKKLLALLLALIMILSLLPTSVLATGSEPTVVIAGSDFQAKGGHAAGATIVNGVIDQIKADGYTKLDGFLFAGDYSVGATKAADVTYLKDTILAAYPELTDDTMVLIQGNHDNASEYNGAEAGLVGNVIDVSGAHDAENYGVYVINEQDYMWRNSSETTIKNTAASLKGYLNAKRNAEYAKPIFVVSHLPLHYCMRTNNDGDGMYANYIFDVLNEAGNAGLNIIFMFGHNHSHGWDDYLGGASIFLTKGDKINIAQSSKTAFKEETLAFTYLNAGYVGYYGDSYTSDVDKTLTMTTFAITDNDVTISRYSANGTHNLKSAGVYNVEHPDNSMYSTDTTTVDSPYKLTLNKEITPAGEEVAPPTGGSTTERTYTLVTSLDELVSDDQYLLIYNGTKFVLPKIVTKSNSSGSQRTGMDLEATDVASGGPATITGQYQAKEWQLVSSSGGWLLSNGTQQIKLTDTGNQGITATFEDAGSPFSLNFNTSHLVSFTHGSWELNYNPSRDLINGYDSTSTAARMYIYKLTSEGATEPAEPTGKTIYLSVGQTRTETIDGEYNTTYTSTNESVVTVTVSGTQGQDGQKTATKANVTCDTLIEEKSNSWRDTGYYYKADDGNYYPVYAKRSSSGKDDNKQYTYTWGYSTTDSTDNVTQIGTQSTKDKKTTPNITVYNPPTTTPAVPASTTVTFKGLAAGTATVTVGSVTYTVIVQDKAQLNDYPEYPNEGSVRVEKTGQGVDFQNTGVAKIELSTTGVPMSKGVDVILMLDTSSSMKNTIDGTPRIDVLRQSVANMLTTFNTPDSTTGAVPDIRVAIADFNGYDYSNSPVALDSNDHLTYGNIRENIPNNAQVYTGTENYTSGAFVAASTYNTAAKRTELVNSITTASGTNYDAAFYYSYQLGQAITDANNTAGEERDLYVVFMSDGAPFQYNGFSADSDESAWNNWLQGTRNDAASGSHRYFYNTDGNKNWWAEAIKGDTGSQYTVIDKTKNTTDTNPYMTQVSGLGAKMYSIGFCLAQDKQITVASMENVLQKIATDSSYYIKADSASDLNNAFNQIATNIKKAGYDATFTDVMGEAYDLKITPFNLANNETVSPNITVSTYQLYKKSEVGTTVNGVTVTEAMVGTRKSDTPAVQETVTFNADGTEAYSSSNPGVNILTDNKINAKLFTYDLTTETFSWNVGDITEDEQVLSYYVYLTGSMEGTRAAGSYPTNKSAVLTYKNWLDHDAQKDTVSPVMPWESANVSYAFYLVDENGTPVVNQTTGSTGSFANAVKVTQPVVYSEVLLNSATEVEANIVAQNALPAGYELYDADAAYRVSVRSGDGTGSWTITKGNSAAATTYVAQYDPNNSAAVSNALRSTGVNGGQNDYTHTVVWFAVKYQISCVPDAVVIDFGLPVDISVLANDILGEGAAVVGLAAVGSIPATQGTEALATGFSTEYTGTYGTATINGTKVRYTPKDMQMNGAEKFAYAAKANLENDQKYYYSTVTVIPAANIYYEDSFVTFNDNGGKWEEIGRTEDGITQQEDRPGQFSLSAYDANNVYGYDAAYNSCTTFSMGSAMKTTVSANTTVNPTATFTFTGTGFDLISLTSNTTGTIFVEVYPVTNNEVGNILHRWAVDTYYGYTRTENGYIEYTWTLTDGQWHYNKEVIPALPDGAHVGGTPQKTGDTTYEVNYQWTVTNDTNNALYQIPVIRGQGLEYGTYKVIIKPTYYPAFDNVPDSTDYDFYLDAVRIYDPAGKNPTGEIGDAYEADGEGWPNVIELRSQLIKEGTLNIDKDNSGSSKGIVFVDGIGDTEGIDDYTNYGPNNEVYLASGQAIAFKLTVGDPSKIASIQLAAKAPQGTAVAQVNDGTRTEITTATEMYYDITHRVTWSSSAETKSNTIVVANTGSKILSLTNIKITYKEAPVSAPEAQVDAQVLEEAPIMLLSMRGITAPVEPEPTFAPERFEAAWNRSTVRAGQKATLTVKTSEDVEAVMVDGVTIDTYRTRTQRTGWGQNATKVTYREFTYTITAAETADYAITAVNAEGIASEPITAALTVQAASQRPSFGGWLDKIFNRWF